MLTRTIFVVVLFAVLKCCHAQPLPVISVTLQSAAVAGPIPYMPSLAEYWEYDKGGRNGMNTVGGATNVAITNWFGQLQGSILTNGASALRPTNSATGVGWNAMSLTNIPSVGGVTSDGQFQLGSNFTVTIIYKNTQDPGSITGGGGTMNLFCNGTNVSGYKLQLTGGGANKGIYTGTDIAAGANDLIPQPATNFWMISYCESNNIASGGGKLYIFTNGIWDSAYTGVPTATRNIGAWFNNFKDPNPDYLVGFVLGMYIQTNWIDKTGASNNWYYYTNVTLYPR